LLGTSSTNWLKFLVGLIGGLLFCWAVPLPAAAQAPGDLGYEEKLAQEATEKPNRPEFSGSVEMLSQYVFRGIALSRDGVVFQPSMTVSYKGFSATIWGNFDTNERNPSGRTNPNRNAAKWNETDFIAAYSKEVLKNLTLSGGMIYYAEDSNNAPDDTLEVFGTVAYKFPWFDVGFQAYWDVANKPGWYLSWDVRKNIKLPIQMKWLASNPSLDLLAGWSAFLSSDRDAYPTEDGSFYRSMNAGVINAGLNFPVHKHVTITPKVVYWYALGGQSTFTIRNQSWDRVQNHILGGVSVSTKF
jgi:uncharacterized protein (TIGR02001 family)